MKNILIIALAIFVSGCADYEQITFLHLKDAKVNGIKNGEILISTKAVFNNPNDFKGKVKSANIYVLYKGDTLAHVKNVEKLKVAPNSTFEMPLSLTVSMDKLQKGLLSNLASLLRKRSVELEFKGNIKVGSFGLTQNIPVNYKETINL